ncbi:MAG: hypothetical protein HFI77_13105 [Lachnospiraceae bacterium]|uniref:hypothetical protein n=1 Tax=Roseburia sp. 1XD42-69 TaxID=2320088 RepID=UPI000EA3E2E5|nr:hypothetical protein [Roseburia sp. 1XD42-69]MCI8876931.1 hypothetical protein [Lachnospiraceae bacterium]RKJ62947.1 hypothetical protein D7Y06_16030 [Roseburia sp. 1XD42-69]
MKRINKYLAMLILSATFLGTFVTHPTDVFAEWDYVENTIFEPFVFTSITNQTSKIRVYAYRDTTLKITNQSETIFEKTYKSTGKKTIKIPQQKARTKLKFTLTSKYGVSASVTKKVKDDGVISNKKVDSSLKKPKISGKITDKSTSVKVYAKKGQTLHIQNGGKVLNKVKYQKTGYQNITIKKQKPETKLTFYVTGKKGRSPYVTKEVKDVTPPEKPEVCFEFENDYSWITVEGEKGADVYVKQNSKHVKGKWKYLGTLENEKGFNLVFNLDNLPDIQSIYAGDTFSVYLKDDAGNKSKVATSEPVKEDYILYDGN